MPIDLGQSGRPRDALVATLHYLEIGCSDPAMVAAFYEAAMGYTLFNQDRAVLAVAPDRQLRLVPGTPRSLSCAGFALPDADELARLRGRIAQAGYPMQDGATAMFSDSVTVRDPDGNCFCFGLPVAQPVTAWSTPSARLQHVVMASRAPAAITTFLTQVIGFTVSDDVVDDEGGVRTTFLRCSQEHHSFAVFQAAENRLDHHCYETADWNAIRDWSDHMAKLHIKLQWGPGRHGPGSNLFIFVHDPDGNWVEISAELENVAHDRPAGQWPHEQRTLNSWGQGLLRS